MLKGFITICAVALLAPFMLACQGGQLLPGESDAAPDKPGKATVTIERRKKATTFRDERTGETFSVDRIGAAKPSGAAESQRDGGKGGANPDQSGELGGGAGSSLKKKDEERRGKRAAAILGSGAGSEGIRDKLGRSGKRGVGKSLG